MTKRKGGRAVEQFYKLVLDMNPILRSDERVNVAMVTQFLNTFETEIGSKQLVNYDLLLEKICDILALPERVVEPFMELYATAYFTMNGRKFIRICHSCGKAHSLDEIQRCSVRDSSVVKTAVGFVLVDDSEDLSSIKN